MSEDLLCLSKCLWERDGGSLLPASWCYKQRYKEMLEDFVYPFVSEKRMKTFYFQQDGVQCHTASIRSEFPGKLISRFGDAEWPSRSPDLGNRWKALWQKPPGEKLGYVNLGFRPGGFSPRTFSFPWYNPNVNLFPALNVLVGSFVGYYSCVACMDGRVIAEWWNCWVFCLNFPQRIWKIIFHENDSNYIVITIVIWCLVWGATIILTYIYIKMLGLHNK